MNVLAIGASTSSKSINRALANYAAAKIPNAVVTDYDLRQLNLPIFSADAEENDGIPADAQTFRDAVRSHDALVVSLAEHNGSYSAAFKNLYDWVSRIDTNVWADKPMILLSTSPGGRGGATVMEAAKATFPRMGAALKGSVSLPSFYDNFDKDAGVTDDSFNAALAEAIDQLA